MNRPGRPPRQTPRITLTVRLEPEVAERFKEICREEGLSQSALVASWTTEN